MRLPAPFSRKREQGRACPNCKAPLAPDQDWCVQCGTNVSGDLRAQAGWFSAGLLTALSVVLVSGAAAAGVAALTQTPLKEPPHKLLVIKREPVLAAGEPPPGQPETLKLPSATPPPSPPTSETSSTSSSPSSSRSSAVSSTTTTTTTAVSQASEPLELQGFQLSVYNPKESYPPADLTNPRQAFEEGSTVLWRVTVHPGGASRIGVGLAIDLERPLHVSSLELRTPTPGFGVEVLGAGEGPLPPSRSSNRWTLLGKSKAVRTTQTLVLGHANQPFRYILLWLTTVPSRLAGSRTSPGKLKIEEVALFRSREPSHS